MLVVGLVGEDKDEDKVGTLVVSDDTDPVDDDDGAAADAVDADEPDDVVVLEGSALGVEDSGGVVEASKLTLPTLRDGVSGFFRADVGVIDVLDITVGVVAPSMALIVASDEDEATDRLAGSDIDNEVGFKRGLSFIASLLIVGGIVDDDAVLVLVLVLLLEELVVDSVFLSVGVDVGVGDVILLLLLLLLLAELLPLTLPPPPAIAVLLVLLLLVLLLLLLVLEVEDVAVVVAVTLTATAGV